MRVHNTGRLQAVVTGLMFGTDDIQQIVTAPSDYPVALGVSAENLWTVDAEDVRKLIEVNRDAAKKRRSKFIATVILGNGTRKHFNVNIAATEKAFAAECG